MRSVSVNCLDTNALIDYLEGIESIGHYLESHHDEPYFAPTIALHEVYVGAARHKGETAVAEARDDLDWVTPLPFTEDAAAEAAVISADLYGEGQPISALDTLIAGSARDENATLITADAHFDRVEGLDVENYREDADGD